MTTIQLLPLVPLDDSTMSYAERLDLVVEHSPSRVTIRQDAKPYDWTVEANAKRPIR